MSAPLERGTMLGPYEVVSLVGAGGMGEVYRARDSRLERHVAVKVLSGAFAADASRLQRLVQEARAVASLSHPNILAIFDVNTSGRPYLVTELLEGQTLRDVLADGPLPFPRVRDIAQQLVAGLHAAHARGIVHRDLKPDNLFLTRDRVVKILDFGLAKAISADADANVTSLQVTQPGLVMGTPGYMAPEQVRGLAADQRADIFALGVIVYELLTGRRAFAGESPADTMSAVLREPLPEFGSLSDVPPTFERIIQRCVEKRPADRFQTVADLRFAIDALPDEQPTAVSDSLAAQNSVAVLPFVNLGGDADSQFFTDGLAEDLINALGRLPGLHVASRTSAFRFRGGDLDLREIGRRLRVGAVLEGSVRRAGDRLRVNVQLANVADGYRVWSERYDREMRDIFDIQDEIVSAIVEALVPALAASTPASRQTDNVEAYELYLKGRHNWHQRSLASLHAALECFEGVVRLDPKHALAHAGVADCYSVFRVYCWYPAARFKRRAQEAVARAVALAPEAPEVAYSQALVAFYFELDCRAAERHLRRALAAAPGYAEVHAYLSLVLASMRRPAEVAPVLQRAMELDPASPVVLYLSGVALNVCGQFLESEAVVRRMLELAPGSMAGLWVLATGLAQQGRYAEALEAAERVVLMSRAPIYLCFLAQIHALAGRPEEARRLLGELDEREQRGEYVNPGVRFYVAVALKDAPLMRRYAKACVADETPLLTVQVCLPLHWERDVTDPVALRTLTEFAAAQGMSVAPSA